MKKVFIISVSIIILSVMIANIVTPEKYFSDNENRALAGFPDFSLESLLNGEMSAQFESYIADQFFRRDSWVSAKAVMEKSIGKKENNGVYFAEDGYLIEVPDYDLETVKSNIEAVKNFGGNYSLLLIPTAYEVLKDKLPKNSYTDIQMQIIDMAKETNIICPISILKENKNEYIYYRTDHHQTAYGSYLTYKYWCEKKGIVPVKYTPEMLTDSFYGSTWSKATLPQIKPDTICTLKGDNKVKVTINDTIEKDSIYDFDKLNEKDKYLVFMGGNYGKAVIETNANTDKSLVMVKDSYANGLLPYFINHYDTITMIDLRYYNQSIKELKADEILFIYSIPTFATDNNLKKIAY